MAKLRFHSYGTIDPYFLIEDVEIHPGVRAAGVPGTSGAYARGEMFSSRVPQLKPDSTYLLLHLEIWYDEDEIEQLLDDNAIAGQIQHAMREHQKGLEIFQKRAHHTREDWRYRQHAIRAACKSCVGGSDEPARSLGTDFAHEQGVQGPGCTRCLFTGFGLPPMLRSKILEEILIPEILSKYEDAIRTQIMDVFDAMQNDEWRTSFVGKRGERIIISTGIDLKSIRHGKGRGTRQPATSSTPTHGVSVDWENREARNEKFIDKVLEDAREDAGADIFDDWEQRLITKYNQPITQAARELLSLVNNRIARLGSHTDIWDDQESDYVHFGAHADYYSLLDVKEKLERFTQEQIQNIYQLFSRYVNLFEIEEPDIFRTHAGVGAEQLDPFNMVDVVSSPNSRAIIYSPERAEGARISKTDEILAELFGHYRNMWRDILNAIGNDRKDEISDLAQDIYLGDWETIYVNAYIPLTPFARQLIKIIRDGRYEYVGQDRILIDADLEGLDKVIKQLNPFGEGFLGGSGYVQDDLTEFIEDILSDVANASLKRDHKGHAEIKFHNGKLEVQLDLDVPEEYWSQRAQLVRRGEEEWYEPLPDPPEYAEKTKLKDDPRARAIWRAMRRKYPLSGEKPENRPEEPMESIDSDIKNIVNDLMGSNDIDEDVSNIADSI